MRACRLSQSIILVVALAGLNACGTSNNNGEDGGVCGTATRCLSDDNCTAPETCQPNGCCAYIDPNANRATGSFGLYMNSYNGWAQITGKLDGKGFYMDLGGDTEYLPANGWVEVQMLGILTSNILNGILLRVPKDPPLNVEIKFGTGGAASGTYDLIDIDNDGYEIGRTSVADIVDGYVTFTEFSLVNNEHVSGGMEIFFKAK